MEIPVDIYAEILQHLKFEHDVLKNISTTNSTFRYHCQQILFQNVHLRLDISRVLINETKSLDIARRFKEMMSQDSPLNGFVKSFAFSACYDPQLLNQPTGNPDG